MSTPAIKLHARFEDDPRRGFATPAAFLTATINESGAHSRDDVTDMRLRNLCARDPNDRSGGELAFLLPAGFTPAPDPVWTFEWRVAAADGLSASPSTRRTRGWGGSCWARCGRPCTGRAICGPTDGGGARTHN